MNDPTTWIRAQIDIDERHLVARRDGHPGPCLNMPGQRPDDYDEYDSCYRHIQTAEATPYRDAEFGLRLVQAHRAILDLHPHRRFGSLPDEWPEHWRAQIKAVFPGTDQPYVGCDTCDFNRDYEVFEPDWWCAHVRALASIYSDRDGYNPEWSA